MPVVRRGDEDGVDLLAVEHAAEVALRLAVGASPLRGAGRVRLVNVAGGDERRAGDLLHEPADEGAARAAANQADIDALVGAEDAAGGEGGQRRGSAGQELATLHPKSPGFFFARNVNDAR